MAVAAAPSTVAHADPPPGERGQVDRDDEHSTLDQLDTMVQGLIGTLRGMLKAIPQYEMPRVTEDGDIIIRRKREADPDSDPLPPPPRDAPETEGPAVRT